jgi:hypothetical protein
MGVMCKILSSKGAFCENRFNGGDKVLKEVNDGVKISAHNAVEKL